jgi:competence protein ComEC
VTDLAPTGESAPVALPPPPRATPQLTDGGAVALAACTALAAWWHRPVPVVLLVGAAVGIVLLRRPAVLLVGVTVLASGLAARSYAGLTPVAAAPWRGVATLVADPVPTMFGWKADVRIGHRRVELAASQGAGGALSQALAGERVRVDGRLAPPRPGSPWLIPRHVVGRLSASSVERVDGGTTPWRAANRFRRLLDAGSASIGEPNRSLYAGFVLGDDRDQPPEIVDDFRGSGLTHLLVVSGDNARSTLFLCRR